MQETSQYQPRYDPGLWIASIRPYSMRKFSQEVFVFQPDKTLFCPNGVQCKLLQAGDSRHCELYQHILPPDDTTPSTPVMNGLPGERVLVSRVKCVWRLPISPATDSQKQNAPNTHPHTNSQNPFRVRHEHSHETEFPSNLHIILYVHGFRQRYLRIVGCVDHLLSQLRHATPSHLHSRFAVMGFVWPCHKRVASYMRAKGNAESAHTQLLSLIETLSLHKNTVSLVGHSLGCRVIVTALSRPISPQKPLEPPILSPHVVLLGAAMASDSLAPGGEFPSNSLRCGTMTVCYSMHDEVLKSKFWFGEILGGLLRFRPTASTEAMGLVGPMATSTVNTRRPSDEAAVLVTALRDVEELEDTLDSGGESDEDWIGVDTVMAMSETDLTELPEETDTPRPQPLQPEMVNEPTAVVVDRGPGPCRVERMDVSAGVAGHNPHLWIMCRPVYRLLARIIESWDEMTPHGLAAVEEGEGVV